jgi:predicted nucleic acid-binding protein
VTVLADTSALYAVLDTDDRNHRRAAALWRSQVEEGHLITHAYVVVEATALVQARLGKTAAVALHGDLLGVVDTLAVDAVTHGRAVERWSALGDRRLSLVDVTSFVVMEDLGVEAAFAFDDDFVRAGFRLVE